MCVSNERVRLKAPRCLTEEGLTEERARASSSRLSSGVPSIHPFTFYCMTQVFYSDRAPRPLVPLTLPAGTDVASCLDRVLRLPSVASKRWLVHKVRLLLHGDIGAWMIASGVIPRTTN